MKKIAILTDSSMFCSAMTSGIRLVSLNIYFALKNLGFEVDFVISNAYKGEYYTYQTIIFEEEAKEQNFFRSDVKINIKSLLFPFILPAKKNLKNASYTKAVEINDYSHIFTSFVAWDKIINYNLSPNIKIFNIYHDNIVEVYRFTKQRNSLQVFNSIRQLKSNMLYSSKILCVSLDAKNQFKDCFEKHEYFKEEKLEVLPQTLLPIYFNQSSKYKVRENSLIVGNIFDERKKPLEAVEIINQMKQIQKLYIYGSPRCKKPLLRKIFNTLRKDIEVEWIMQAATSTIIDLFSKSKALLFPSEFEGLGLPIIEAQVRGCPVIVRNKPPMNSLILEGSILMSASSAETAKILDNLFLNFNQNEALQKNAHQVFSSEKLEKFLKSIL